MFLIILYLILSLKQRCYSTFPSLSSSYAVFWGTDQLANQGLAART